MTAPQGPNQPWQPPQQPGLPPQNPQWQPQGQQWQPPMYGGYRPMGTPQTAGYVKIGTPVVVNLSFAAWLLGAVVSLVLLIIAIVDLQTAVEQSADVARGVKFAYLALAIWGVCIAGFALFAFFMRAGHQWARMTLSGLTVLSILGVIISPDEVSPYLVAGCALLGTVLFYLPAANAYFRTASTS